MRTTYLAVLLLASAVCGCFMPEAHAGGAAENSRSTVISQGSDFAERPHGAPDLGDWPAPGGDFGGSYYSSLSQINATSVARLGFAWQYELGTTRGLEASPLVVDGTMYAVGNYGRVYAVAADTGKERWRFTPVLDNQWIRFACCDAVNRGLAIRDGRIFVGALDGYLYCLDAGTGRVVWKVDTFIGRVRHVPYSLTGAPVLTRDSVVIGNGGGDFEGVRGYISAYDLQTGKFKWRFFTVPRDPALGPQDQPHLIEAVKTWDPRHEWRYGGGGTVWDGLSYDAKYDLVYMGTGNVSPYNTHKDGRAGGDALYASSVIAVSARSGALAWYFQEVPDDHWDFDADQKFIITRLNINGAAHDVLLHAAKNGYFYVFERESGAVLAAANFAFVSWTKGLDPTTHRPISNPAANYDKAPAMVWPSAAGAHSWQPMSFDPKTGLVYLPTIEMAHIYIDVSARPAGSVEGWFTVQGIAPGDYDPAQSKNLYGPLPSLKSLQQAIPGPVEARSVLKAWDPVRGKVVWEAPGASIWDGGIMSTGGSLVFRGDSQGFLNVFAADSGKLLKKIDVGTAIMAAPVTYLANGQQFVAFMAGYGGAAGFQFPPDSAAYKYGNAGRIVVLKLDGAEVPHPKSIEDEAFPEPPARAGTAASARRGEILFNRFCSRCHVFGRGIVPDLRRMSAATHRSFFEIVLHGAYQAQGMARWDDVLDKHDAQAIHDYLVVQSWSAYQAQQKQLGSSR